MLENNENKDILARIHSEDPDERRQAIEEFFHKEMDGEILKNICDMINDPDQGVRDAVNNVLMLSDNPEIPNHLVNLVSAPEIIIRNLAGEILLRKGEASVDSLLGYLIKTDNPDDQKFIIDILGLIGDKRVEADVIEILHKTNNENVILSCLEAFGNLASENAYNFLTDYYHKNELYRPTIIEALGKINLPEALDFITDKYATEEPLVQYAILDTLGKIGNEATFYFLLTELKKYDPPMTWVIIHSLWELKNKYELDIPFDDPTKIAILNSITGAENEYKKPAISLLKAFIDEEVFLSFLNNYGYDYSIDEEIQEVLTRDSLILLSQLVDYLSNQPKNIRAILELVRQTIEMNGEDVVGMLDEILKHKLCEKLSVFLTNPDEEVRRLVMELMFLIKRDMAMIFVDTMLSDTNVWNKLRLIELLEFNYTEESINYIKLLIEDPDEMVKDRAMQVITNLNHYSPEA